MSMRVLVIDDTAKAEIARVREYAEANPYYQGGPTPGDNPAYVAKLGDFRAVFTITHAKTGEVLRHLSVSVPGTKLPHPAAAFMIADAFGFTGWDATKPAEPGKDWMFGAHHVERCAVVVQQITH
jgi:hypothetical protein